MISPFMALALMFSSCVKPVHTDNNTTGVPAETLKNVAYGTDPKQKMDIYLPVNRSTDSTRLILFIHGGGWNEGDKADFDPYVKELQKRLPGYAFANINYRLFNFNTGENKFPAQENDVKAGVGFLKIKVSEYKISETIILLGASAGAHLALLEGYKNNDQGKVKGIVSFFGPTDMIEFYDHHPNPGLPALMKALIGTTPSENKASYEQSSPIHFVTAKSAPTLILQGGQDALVPENQSVLLKNKLTGLGVINQYVYYPNEGHGWAGNNLIDSFDKIAAFLRNLN